MVRWTRMPHANGARRWLTFELSGRHRRGAREADHRQRELRGRHAGGGPRSSEGLASATVTKRTEGGGGTAWTGAFVSARPLRGDKRCTSNLRLHGEDEANHRFEGAGTTD